MDIFQLFQLIYSIDSFLEKSLQTLRLLVTGEAIKRDTIVKETFLNQRTVGVRGERAMSTKTLKLAYRLHSAKL